MSPAKGFYLKLYLFWLFWVSSRSVALAALLSCLSALVIYLSKGMAPLNQETMVALKEIAFLSFPIAFSLSFIITLLLVFKALFSQKIDGKKICLYDCQQRLIEKPLLSDVTMIWRKWLFRTIWTIIIFLVIFVGLWRLISGELLTTEWFNGLNLYLLVITFGGAVFVFGIKTCKKIRIKDA